MEDINHYIMQELKLQFKHKIICVCSTVPFTSRYTQTRGLTDRNSGVSAGP